MEQQYLRSVRQRGRHFPDAENYGVDHWPWSVAIEDLDGDGALDLAVANRAGNNISVLINRSAENIIAAELTCVPASGTIPFMVSMTVGLTNQYNGQTRRIAGHIDLQLAGRLLLQLASGLHQRGSRSDLSSLWVQTIPDLGSVIGTNTFTLVAEDVTPSPYNQPPYPPAGDIDMVSCTVTGIAP